MANQSRRQLSPEERKRRIAYKKRRKVIVPISRISFLVTLIAAVALLLVIKGLGYIPAKYIVILGILLGVLVILMGFVSLVHRMSNKAKLLQSLFCILLSALMIFGAIVIPSYSGKIKRMFTKIPEETTLNINVYTLGNAEYAGLGDLAGKTLGIQSSVDQDNQAYGILQVNRETRDNPVQTYACEDIYDLVDKLKDGTVDAILLNESYVEILLENADYSTFTDETKVIYTCYKKVKIDLDVTKVGTITEQPFVIGILGNDEWGTSNVKNTSGFRTDVNMLLVVNPKTKQALMITVPRDAYVAVGGYTSQMDKLTHATMYDRGIAEWVDTMKAVFQCNINYTFKVNFSTITGIVDTLGGVDINNPYEFKATAKVLNASGTARVSKTVTFKKGNIHLNGDEALAYCRERKSLSGGDMARNKHQAIILKALINKVTSPDIVNKVSEVLDSLKGKFLTNMDVNEMLALAKMQIEDPSVIWDIQSYSLSGENDMAGCYIMNGLELSIVRLNSEKVNSAIVFIQKMLAGERIDTAE